MKRDFILNRIIKVMLLVLSLTLGQNAWAESTWTVENDKGKSNTFTIKRSEKGFTQTVHFRTISLSAYAGQHFTAVDMDYTFLDNEDEKTVTVTEMTPTTNAYKYQTGTSRKYGFEVIDRAGFRLAYAERSKTWGTSINSDYAFAEKSITVQSAEFKVTDKGYSDDTNPARSVSSSGYYSSTAPKEYLVSAGAELRMTLGLDVKEGDDGYQHLQILVDNTSTCDGGDNKEEPGTPSLSRYMVSFAHDPSNTNITYASYTFPLTSKDDNCGLVTNAWNNGVDNKLYNQKFYSGSRASDGKLILPTDFSTLVLRFDASGKNNDDWYAKNVKAYIQAVDVTNPTKSAVSVNPGRHAKGNTVYVSVAFSEIVTLSGTPTLSTTSDNKWGDLTYVYGSGTNVLTFSTTIPQDATGSLNITGLSGTVKDLAGNSLNGSGVTASGLCTLDADFAYTTLSDFNTDDSGNYLIQTHEDLIGLAGYVNGGGDTKNKTFLQVADIAFPHTTNWDNANSTENNYNAIGYFNSYSDNKSFQGTFNGQGYTISGIRIYKGGEGTPSCSYQGIFGFIRQGTIRGIHLTDTRITAHDDVGGIVGNCIKGVTVEDCIVDANVCIHAVKNSSCNHGGIVGENVGLVRRCISHATLSVKYGLTDCKKYGGIVGHNDNNNITDCIADGVVIPDVNGRGAIVGYNGSGILARNYYHGCKVASISVTPSGVGQGNSSSSTETSDADGACVLWAITLPNHTSVVRTGNTLPGTNNLTYDNGADINGVPYAKGSSVVNLSCDPATITEGYDVLLAVKKTGNSDAVDFTDNGNYTYTIASMPAADITVSTTEIPVIAYIDADGNPQSHACIPIVSSTTNYQTLGRTEGWYVVNSDASFTNETVKFLDQAVHIILCDGAKFKNYSGQYKSLEVSNGSLEILAQSNGSGELYLTSSGSSALVVNTDNKSIDINGGTIRISDGTYGIFASQSNVTIRRGIVSISGRNGGICASNIILGCSNVNDGINVKSYNGTVTISDGQILFDGIDTYSGTLNIDEIAAIAGKTLQKCFSLALPSHVIATGIISQDGTTAYAFQGVTITLSAATSYTISDVTVNGASVTDNGGTWTFIMPASNVTVSAKATLRTFTVRFNKNNGEATGTMSDQLFFFDVEQALSTNGFSLKDYGFIGWSTTADGVVEFTDEQPVWNLTAESGGIVELYAKWSSVNTYAGFTATSGLEGSWTAGADNRQSDTRYEKLVDGNKSTPWLTVSSGYNGFRTLYIEFNHTEPIVPKGYILTTGTDVENNPCRNPKSWTLKGKLKSSDEWTTLATVTNDTRLPATNTTDVVFSLEDNDASYRYYRFEITAIRGQQSNNDWTMELGELQLTGTKSNANYDMANASVFGLGDYLYTGNEIDYSYVIKDASGKTLTEGVDYTVVIKRGGVEVSKVLEAGEYTLTVIGTGNPHSGYYGSKTFTFSVIGPYSLYGPFSATKGQEGSWTADASSRQRGTRYEKLVDGNKSTPWLTVSPGSSGFRTLYIEFNYTEPIVPKGYILTTGADVENNPCRNPKSWTLKGKLSNSDEWTTIATVTNDNRLPATNTTDVVFSLEDNDASYRYYRFEITAIRGQQSNNDWTMELGELQLTGTKSNANYDMANASVFGLGDYLYTGNEIDYSYVIKDASGNTLTEGVDYTVVIKRGGVEVSRVLEAGEYTLTVTGTGNPDSGYYGSRIFPFFVINSYPIYGSFTATKGQEGSWTAGADNRQSDTRYEKLVDGNKSTPWLTVSPGSSGFRTLYIEFNYTEPIVPKGYILTTGADVENNPCRNPKSWTLKGKLKSSDEWTTLATVTNDTRLPATNTTDVVFSLEDNGASYRYYRFEITAIRGQQSNNDWTTELGELQLMGYACVGVTLETVGGDLTASFSGTSLETVNIPAPGVTVKQVTYDRTFSAGKASTVMLPFDYTCNGNEGGTFYRFVGVEKENNIWVATMQLTSNALTANTPYLFLPTGTGITFTIPNEGVTLCTEGGGGGQTADSGSHWTFKGTNSYIKWTNDTGDPDYSAEREAEIGKIYGFAGLDKNGVKAGDFVKVASGAKIRPMSAYLIWSNTANLAPARGGMNAASASADELPKSITVRLINANGTVTNVGEIDMETGELSFDGWYTLQGVKLEAEPTESGIYINNGKTVSIKK